MTSTAGKKAYQLHLIDPLDLPIFANDNEFEEIRDEANQRGTQQCNRIAIQIFGESRAGKTSLRKKLMGEKFDPNEGRTIGIDTQMCEYSLTNQHWKHVKEVSGDELDDSISWYISKRYLKLTAKMQEMHSSKSKEWTFIFLMKCLLPFAFMLILNVFLAVQNIFVISMLACFLVNIFLFDKITSYRLAGGFALYLLLVEVLCELFGNLSTNEYVLFYTMIHMSLCFMIGFIFGISMGTGLRVGLTIAFVSMLAPHDNVMCSIPSCTGKLLDRLVWITGIIFACLLHDAFTKFSWKRLEMYSMWLKLRYAFLMSLLVGLFMSVISVWSAWFSPHIYMFVLSTMTMVGIVPGIKFGRALVVQYHDHINHPVIWIIALITGLVCGYMRGWSLPLSVDTPSVVGMCGMCTIVCVEIYRKTALKPSKLIKDVHFHTLTHRELQQTSLPVKNSIWDFAGNSLFYDSHHVFIASHAIFLLVFNLEAFEFKADRDNQLQHMLVWLHSICVHSKHSDSIIFLVATRRDGVPYETRQEVAKYLMEKLYNSKSIYCKRLAINKDNTPLFVIECSKTGDDEDVMILKTAKKKKVPTATLR